MKILTRTGISLVIISIAFFLALLIRGPSYSQTFNCVIQNNSYEVTIVYLNSIEITINMSFAPNNVSVKTYVLNEPQTKQLVFTGSLLGHMVEAEGTNGTFNISFRVPHSGYYSIVVFNPNPMQVQVRTKLTGHEYDSSVVTISTLCLVLGAAIIFIQKITLWMERHYLEAND